MKAIYIILLALLGSLGVQAQTAQPNLPTGAERYSQTLWIAPDSTLWTGKSGNYTRVATNKELRDLAAQGYTRAQVDSAITANLAGYVPTSRTVNGKPLTGNITLNSDDVGALQSGDNVSELTNDAGYITAGDIPSAPVTSVNGKTGAVTVTASDVGLGNVDNTSDANKPISTATQSALDGKEDAFSKGSIVAGTNVTLSGTLANRLVGSGNITINATNSLTASNGLQISSGNITPVYGTGANTIAQGNDSRINNGQTAYGWGDYRQYGLGSFGSAIQINDITSSDANYARFFRSNESGITGSIIAMPWDGTVGSTSRTNYLRVLNGNAYIGWKSSENATPVWWNLWTSNNFNPNNYVLESAKGAVNGVASLDGSGKVPTSQLPTTGMQYQGTWNASTNSPALSDVTGTDGYFYRVTVAGTQNLGSGSITFSVGDDVIHNGSVWQRAPSGVAVTNLSVGTRTNNSMVINSSTGTGATLPSATTTQAGLMRGSDYVTLNSALQSETDPTVPSHVKSITTGNINDWNASYRNEEAGIPAKGGDYLVTSPIGGTTESINFNSKTGAGFYKNLADNGSTNAPATGYWYVYNMRYGSTNLTQIAYGYREVDGTYIRHYFDGSWSAWRKFWTSADFDKNSFLPANYQPSWGDVTGKPSTFTPSAHTHNASDINAGTLAIARIPTGTTGSTVALGNHTHTFASITSKPTTLSGYGITDGVPTSRTLTINGTTYNLSANRSWTLGASDVGAEPAFSKNTAFNKNFGTASGTVAQGNDSRIVNAAQRNAANTFSGANTFSQPIVATQYQGTAVSASSSIPTNSQSLFTASVSSNTTYTLTNMTGNPRHIQVIVTNTSGSDVFITFNGAKLPVSQSNRIEAGYTAIFTFLVNDGSAYGTKTTYAND